MSDPENLLARWSRRKHDARAGDGDVDATANDREAAALNSGTPPRETPLPFDLASLPALDSIDAETDLRAFLRQDVPPELTRAALRRGWSTDPAIRNFIGLSENSWDFNAPGGIPGFGTLEPGEIQRLLAQLIGEGASTEDAAPTPSPSDQIIFPTPGCASGSELSQDGSAQGGVPNDANSSVDQDVQQQHAASVQRVSTDDMDVETSTARPTLDQDVDGPSHQQRHGGALPRFDVD